MTPKRDNRPAQTRAGQTGAPARTATGPALGQGLSRGLSVSGPEGDDLSRARLFCIQAGAELEAIGAGQQARDLDGLTDGLTRIQREAKRARARGIYRGAQDVLGLVQHHQKASAPDWPRIDARLFVLSKLVDQYETGLREVERVLPEDPAEDLGQDLAEKRNAPARPIAPSDHEPPARETARRTLTNLLPHASAEEQDLLSRLMDAGCEPLDPENQTFGPVDDAPVPEDETDPVDMTIGEDTSGDDEPLASLETIMPDLVQRLLGVAHQYGKVLAVSHDVETVHLPQAAMAAGQAHLYETLCDLIAGDLPLQGVGHLDIAAANAVDSLDEPVVRVSGSGFTTFDLILRADVPAQTGGAARPDGWTPMITEDVEADLRAQLSALLDGGF